MITEYTLTRTGQAPLTFVGDLLASAGGQMFHGREQNRWYVISLYRTAGGQYILAIGYRTQWAGEADYDEAIVTGPDMVGAELTSYDPASPVQGFPPGEAHAEKQARLMAHLRVVYQDAVSDLLADVPELAERIE